MSLNEKIDLILNKLINIENKIQYLENIILKNNLNELTEQTDISELSELTEQTDQTDQTNIAHKELKHELFELDRTFIKDCLNMYSIQGDVKLFKKMYIDNIPKECLAIKYTKRKYQYWLNNCLISDTNGNYIKNIIIKNIEQCYTSINIYDEYTDNMDLFIKNQDYITKLSDDKYKDLFLTKIRKLI